MISLAHARRSDRLMQATTGLTVAEFDALAGRLESLWADTLARHTVLGTDRQRRPGGGCKGVLDSAAHKLFFILLYYKAYPTQDVMGLLFELTQGQVSHWVGRLTALVSQLMELHKPTRRVGDLAALLTAQPQLQEVIVDGTERRIPRPQRRDRQRRYYSGRKKRPGVKNVLVTAQGQVRWLSATRPAREHDKTVADKERWRLPADVTVLGDSGFAGLEAGPAVVITPWKKPRGRKLHWRRRAFNRLLARERVPVEHTLASVKRLRILRDEFRNRRKGMVDEVMVLGCALHNYRWTRRHGMAA